MNIRGKIGHTFFLKIPIKKRMIPSKKMAGKRISAMPKAPNPSLIVRLMDHPRNGANRNVVSSPQTIYFCLLLLRNVRINPRYTPIKTITNTNKKSFINVLQSDPLPA